MEEYTTFPSIRPGPDIAQAMAKHEGLVRRQWLGDLSYPRRGTAFSTYAVPAIKRAVWRAMAQARPHPQRGSRLGRRLSEPSSVKLFPA